MIQRTSSSKKDRLPRRAASQVYPFSAIVGQEEMKLALLLNVIDPLIGGVLIMGHRGTGKSTAVRAIADLLPQAWKVTNCLYGCDPADVENLCDDCSDGLSKGGKLARVRSRVPVVTIPLGATEDRVCGSIDIQSALKDGVRVFEPGLLARANRGFLYVDEVNLLEDHLVDLLLDVAVTGRNTVEREGISLEHPSRFVLVGSGNPEEGELRPQLVDRFGLCAEVRTLEDVTERVEIVNLREAFDSDAAGFRTSFETEQQKLRSRLTRARKQSGRISISTDLMRNIASLCQQLRIDGHRGELTIARAARALAGFDGRSKVTEDDVRLVAPLSLRHRLRRDPLEPTSDGGGRVEQALENAISKKGAGVDNISSSPQKTSNGSLASGEVCGESDSNDTSNGSRPGHERDRLSPAPLDTQLPELLFRQSSIPIIKKRIRTKPIRKHRTDSGSSNNLRRGRYSRAVMNGAPGSKIALDATLRATAMNACRRYQPGDMFVAQLSTLSTVPPSSCSSDLRFKVYKRKQGTLFIMAIDTSGSMAANRIDRAKGALVWLLGKSYIRRDRVALVSFRGEKAEELLQPTQSMSRARRILDELVMGGATPLSSAILCSLNIARRASRKGTEHVVLLVFSDGRANVTLHGNASRRRTGNEDSTILSELDQLCVELRDAGVSTVIVDTQNRFTSGGEGQVLADRLGAKYVRLPTKGSDDNPFLASNLLAT